MPAAKKEHIGRATESVFVPPKGFQNTVSHADELWMVQPRHQSLTQSCPSVARAKTVQYLQAGFTPAKTKPVATSQAKRLVSRYGFRRKCQSRSILYRLLRPPPAGDSLAGLIRLSAGRALLVRRRNRVRCPDAGFDTGVGDARLAEGFGGTVCGRLRRGRTVADRPSSTDKWLCC